MKSWLALQRGNLPLAEQDAQTALQLPSTVAARFT